MQDHDVFGDRFDARKLCRWTEAARRESRETKANLSSNSLVTIKLRPPCPRKRHSGIVFADKEAWIETIKSRSFDFRLFKFAS
jgi:hypothetical protein